MRHQDISGNTIRQLIGRGRNLGTCLREMHACMPLRCRPARCKPVRCKQAYEMQTYEMQACEMQACERDTPMRRCGGGENPLTNNDTLSREVLFGAPQNHLQFIRPT